MIGVCQQTFTVTLVRNTQSFHERIKLLWNAVSTTKMKYAVMRLDPLLASGKWHRKYIH